MEIKNNIKIHNRFDIEIVDKNTGELKQSLVSYNIVLNQMYTRLCGGLSYFVNIHFGSGNGTLSPSRTTLFTHLGTKAAVDEEIIKAVPLSLWKRKIVLNPEEYVGNTISEVGIAFGSTNSNLVTHSLLKDSEGNSLSIVKTDTDVITIYATVFVTFDNSNPNLVYLGMPSSNQLVNYLIGGGTAPTGTFGLIDTLLSDIRLGSTATVTWTSDVSNKQRKTNVSRFATTVANGDVKYLEFTNVFRLELPYAPVFAGQIYVGVSLGFGDGVSDSVFLLSANVRQSSLVVKKNGVVTNDYSLETIMANHYNRIKNTPTFTIKGSIYGASISEDGNRICITDSSSDGGVISIFDGANWSKKVINSNITGSKFTGDGNKVVISRVNAVTGVVIYDWDGIDWVSGVTISPNLVDCYGIDISSDGLLMAVAHGASPYISIYNWNGTSWIKSANPSELPTTTCNAIIISEDKLTIGVVSNNSPYIFVYDLVGSVWVKRSNPTELPTGSGRSVKFSTDKMRMAVAHDVSPFITVYNWNGTSWVKMANPSELPTGNGKTVSLSKDGGYMIVGQESPMAVNQYYLNLGKWVKIRSALVAMNSSVLSSCLSGQNRLVLGGSGSISTQYGLYEPVPMTKITFDTAPSTGDVITADYTVDGVHKTDQYVIDVSFAIQFGEI